MFSLTGFELARIQFGFTISFHIVFPAISIGLASYLSVLEGLWLWKKETVYRNLYHFWSKIFAVNFAMGVVSGRRSAPRVAAEAAPISAPHSDQEQAMTILQTSISRSSELLKAILIGGTVAGLLDAVNVVIFNFFAHGMGPIQGLQYIASAFFGKASFDMGLSSAIAGLLSHFFISYVLAAIFVGAILASPVLRRFSLQLGALYGIAVFFTMNFIILPFTNVVHSDVTTAFLVNGIIGHALLVGLPIAIFARQAVR